MIPLFTKNHAVPLEAPARHAERSRAPYDLRQVSARLDRRASASGDFGKGGWNSGRKEEWFAQKHSPRLTFSRPERD